MLHLSMKYVKENNRKKWIYIENTIWFIAVFHWRLVMLNSWNETSLKNGEEVMGLAQIDSPEGTEKMQVVWRWGNVP